MAVLGQDFLVILAFALPALACALAVSLGLIVGLTSPNRAIAQSVSIFFFALASWSLSIAAKAFPGFLGNHELLAMVLNFPVLFVPAAALHFAYRASAREDTISSIVVQSAWMTTALFVLLQVFGFIFDGFSPYSGGSFSGAGPALPAFIAFVVVSVFGGAIMCWLGMSEERNVATAVASKYWLIAATLLLPAALLNFMLSYGVPLIPSTSISMIAIVLLFARGIYQTALFEIDRETITSIELAVLMALTGLVGGLSIGGALFFGPGAVHFGGIIICGAIAYVIFRNYSEPQRLLERLMERILFPDRTGFRSQIRELASAIDIRRSQVHIDRKAVELVVSVFKTNGAGFYFEGKGSILNRYAATDGFNLPESVPLTDSSAITDDFRDPATTCTISVTIESPGRRQRRGVLVVGPKLSGAPFDDGDRTLLTMVASQVGLALELEDACEALADRESELAELRKRIEEETAAIHAEVRVNPKFDGIIGDSNELLDVLHAVELAASADIAVLVTGETGTGKELIARSIHNLSPRCNGPLVAVNCPAIPVELAESELFGHERGAFTGAQEARPGRIEEAHGGTLFLDEVADLPMAVQIKLLRVLEERECLRLGGKHVRKVDFRIVAATNRDLHAEAAAGRFRTDLLHRLTGMQLVVPPLRSRRVDIPALAMYFLQNATTRVRKELAGFNAEAMQRLVDYPWPGNIRQLRQVVDRAAVLCDKNVVQAIHLGDLQVPTDPLDGLGSDSNLTGLLRDEKIRRVKGALDHAEGNQAAAARLLGMSRSNLSRLMKRYGIKAQKPERKKKDTPVGNDGKNSKSES